MSRPKRLFPHPMYVCVCNGVTERDIRQAAKSGCGDIATLTMRTGCGACCGSCVDMACRVLQDACAQPRPVPRDNNIVAFPALSSAA